MSEKFPDITPETIKEKEALISFIPLAEIIARKELKSLPPHIADFKELVNIGLIEINNLIKKSNEKQQNYNASYIMQAISWSIKNSIRKDASQRGEFKVFTKHEEENQSEFSIYEVQEAVLETIISYEDSSFEIADEKKKDPYDQIELDEMKKSIREAIALLPDNYRNIIELRFYKGMKGVDIAEELGITSTRITHIIKDALELIKERLLERKLL